ncbi:hypothetical protein [Halonatronum saccharophilum]|uniref:hypothetical protein n=1 Tax=Halonatronum saccharophilum TaxID=150060 RepID=UPI000483249C|nr:hypothetical protein [Halonatronum saccharophilum]
MIRKSRKSLVIVLIMIILLSQSIRAQEVKKEGESFLVLQTSVRTHHWNRNPDRNNDQGLIGLEYHRSRSDLYGLAHFENSYYQPTWYFYTGSLYDIKEFSRLNLYGKLTYGIITGYDDEDGEHRAVINRLGTFPAILPTLGIEYNNYAFEVSFFGNSGYIANIGIRF